MWRADGCRHSQQGHPRADQAIVPERAAERFDQRPRRGIEHRSSLAHGHGLGLGKDAVALETEGRQLRGRGAGQHLVQREARRNTRPDQGEEQRRDHGPQRPVPGMISGKRMGPRAGSRADEGAGPGACRQPADQAEPENEQDRCDW